jgi:hypothetical protein
MVFEFPKDKYLTDSEAEKFIISEPLKTLHKAILSTGYKYQDVNYRSKSVLINISTLKSDFEPIENSGGIMFGENQFYYRTTYWYNSKLDIYLHTSFDLPYDEDPTDDRTLYYVYYNYDRSDEVVEYMNNITYMEEHQENRIDIIVQSTSGYSFQSKTISSPEIDLNTMYNEDFTPVYKHVVDKLNNADKGIVLFYGEPGTGKTSLIKHLTTVVKNKFVFVPINIIGHLTSPTFIGDLMNHKGCVLVIEDCENFIQDRKISNDSIVSPLLQLTDGILSDVLNVKVICTFNTDLTRVDPALLREGRLIAEYEFKELSQDRVEQLTDETVEGAQTLANIFNKLTYKDNKKEEVLIGFGR